MISRYDRSYLVHLEYPIPPLCIFSHSASLSYHEHFIAPRAPNSTREAFHPTLCISSHFITKFLIPPRAIYCFSSHYRQSHLIWNISFHIEHPIPPVCMSPQFTTSHSTAAHLDSHSIAIFIASIYVEYVESHSVVKPLVWHPPEQ